MSLGPGEAPNICIYILAGSVICAPVASSGLYYVRVPLGQVIAVSSAIEIPDPEQPIAPRIAYLAQYVPGSRARRGSFQALSGPRFVATKHVIRGIYFASESPSASPVVEPSDLPSQLPSARPGAPDVVDNSLFVRKPAVEYLVVGVMLIAIGLILWGASRLRDTRYEARHFYPPSRSAPLLGDKGPRV
jgi:hypothetical protein